MFRRQRFCVPSFSSGVARNFFFVIAQLFIFQPFSVDSETPDYDLDSEDEAFLETVLQKQKGLQVDLTAFEDMIDRLEKNSGMRCFWNYEDKLSVDIQDLIQVAPKFKNVGSGPFI